MRWIAVLPLLLVASAPADPPKADFVRVDKSEARLYLLKEGQVLEDFAVAFGANPQGHKRQEGDERTPEGRYVLDFKKSDSAFHRAIHVSYPNAEDVQRARERGVSPGGAIMIHGQRNSLGWLSFLTQRFNWTDGCIALSNRDMDRVWSMVDAGTTIEIQP